MKVRIKTSMAEMEGASDQEDNQAVENKDKGRKQQLPEPSQDAYEFNDEAVQQPTGTPCSDQQVVPSAMQPIEAEEPGLGTPARPNEAGDQAVSTTGSQVASSVHEEDLGVRCACGCNEDDGLMILCEECHRWSHGWCYLVQDENQAPALHVCDLCTRPGLQCTDPTLSDLSDIAKQATCLWRRSLMACMEMSRVLPPMLSRRLGVEIRVAQGLINRMEQEGFLKVNHRAKRLGRVVDKNKLSAGIEKYFRSSFLAQDSQQEPMDQEETVVNEQKPRLNDNGEMANLRTRTENLNLSLSEIPPPPVQEPEPSQTKRGRKRGRSTSLPKCVELSNSQDDYAVPVYTGKKRKVSRTVTSLKI